MIHRPCPMIGWSLVSSRLFSEQGACRGLRPAAGCHRPDGQGRHGDVGRDGIHHGSEADDDDRHQPYPGPAVRPLVTHAHVLRLSFGPRRDWRGSVARLLPDGLSRPVLMGVDRQERWYRLTWRVPVGGVLTSSHFQGGAQRLLRGDGRDRWGAPECIPC